MRRKSNPVDAEPICTAMDETGQPKKPKLPSERPGYLVGRCDENILDLYPPHQHPQVADLLNPIAERAEQVGLDAAMQEHWDSNMNPEAQASMNQLVSKLAGSNPSAVIDEVSHADAGACRVLGAIVATAQGWKGEQI